MVSRIFRILLLGFILFQIPLFAEEEGRLRVKLVVLGPGPELYAWWGHTGLIVEDRLQGSSVFYDFGNFSFEEDHFYRNFLMGRLIYEGVDVPAELYLRYASSLGRELDVYTLKMPQDKANELYRLLKDQVSPENSSYLYDHFIDNCSTRIRDYLDMAYDGRLKELTGTIPSGSFRSEFRRFSYFMFPVDFTLNFLQGKFPDQRITQWDAQFLPTELGRAIMILDGEDSIVESVAHLASASPGLPVIPEEAPPLWPNSLLWGGTTALLLLGCWLYSQSKGKSWGRKLSYISVSLIAGIPGSLLFFMSFFTDHHVTYNNGNLLFCSPLVLLSLFFFGKDNNRARLWLKGLWTLLSAMALFVLLKDILLRQGQQNGGIALYYLPLFLLLTLGSWGFFQKKDQKQKL